MTATPLIPGRLYRVHGKGFVRNVLAPDAFDAIYIALSTLDLNWEIPDAQILERLRLLPTARGRHPYVLGESTQHDLTKG
jgi:hypothetical protein